MELRDFGATGLRVSQIGLGLAALGRPGYLNLGHDADLADTAVEAMERHCHAVLDAAYHRGVRYLDAARSYGRAEAFLASWLDARGPGDVTVGSKWGYTYTAGWRADAATHEVKDHSLATFTRQLAESRALLGDRLALYQVHSATLDSGVLDDEAVLDGLAGLRAEGVVVGLSLSGPAQAETLRRARAVERDGRPLFGAVQATWNLLERSAGPALAEASAAGLGVAVKEALANGRLTDRGEPVVRAALHAVADEAGVPVDALALAAVLAQPWAHVVLSGAATAEQLASNATAVAVPAEAATDPRLDALVEPPQAYWRHRSSLPWT